MIGILPAMLNLITVVIPQRQRNPHDSEYKEKIESDKERLDRTIDSIFKQSIGICVVDVIPDGFMGANWARNYGFRMVRTPFVIFSDDDIIWEPDAFENLYHALYTTPSASYSYGWYEMGDRKFCDKFFDPRALIKQNYISTMSLIRSDQFPGFDENIKRLQDWDLWLTMLFQDKVGVYCGEKIFSTDVRDGISFGRDSQSWEEAEHIVRTKHHL